MRGAGSAAITCLRTKAPDANLLLLPDLLESICMARGKQRPIFYREPTQVLDYEYAGKV